MIELPRQIFVATQPINRRLSFDRLAGIIRTQLAAEPSRDHAFVFHNKRRTHRKILWRRTHGFALLYLRLDRGNYLAMDPAGDDQPRHRRPAHVPRSE